MNVSRFLRLASVLSFVVLCLGLIKVQNAHGEQGGFVLKDTKKEISDNTTQPADWNCGSVEFLGSSSMKTSWSQTSLYGLKPSVAAVSTHSWTIPSSILRAGEEVLTKQTVMVAIEKAGYDLGFQYHTAIRVDTDLGGPLFSGQSALASGSYLNFPSNNRLIEKTVKWKVPTAKMLYITFYAGTTGTAPWAKVSYIYEWKDDVQKEEPPRTTPVDISGVWSHGPGGESWTFTPLGNGRYTAVEKGFGNSSGTAVVTGNKVHIEYTSKDGKVSGQHDVTIAEDGKTATGTWKDTSPASGSSSWKKISEVSIKKEMTIRAESRKTKAGKTVMMPIWLENASSIANINFEVKYNSSVANAEKVIRGDMIPKSTLYESNSMETGIVRIGFAGSKDISGSGPVAQIPFIAKGSPGDKTILKLKVTTVSSAEGIKPAIKTIDGSITIVGDEGLEPGDANANGKLDAGDALEALKMSVKLIPEKKVCDMDKDGQVTSTDARLILQKVVGK